MKEAERSRLLGSAVRTDVAGLLPAPCAQETRLWAGLWDAPRRPRSSPALKHSALQPGPALSLVMPCHTLLCQLLGPSQLSCAFLPFFSLPVKILLETAPFLLGTPAFGLAPSHTDQSSKSWQLQKSSHTAVRLSELSFKKSQTL